MFGERVITSCSLSQLLKICISKGFPDSSVGKKSVCNAGDLSSIPELGRSAGEGIGYPLQYSCLENPVDGGAWQAAVHGVAESRTRLHFHVSLSCIGEGNGNPL